METIKNIAQELKLPSLTGGTGKLYRGDKVIWAIVVLLVFISLLVVYSSTGSLAYRHNKGNEFYLFKQFGFIVIGVLIIYFSHRINYTLFSRIALWMYIFSIPLLLYTLIFGSNLNEANRWIMLPVVHMTLQTSDLAKLALFMLLARQLSRKQDVITDWKKGFLPLMAPVVLTCILIAPANLSTSLLVGANSMLLMFIGRVQIKHLLLAIGVMLIPVALLILIAVGSYKAPNSDVAAQQNAVVKGMKSHGRVGTWIHRVQDFIYAQQDEIPYQVQQANIAIASGSWFGLGPGNSQQRNYLPHPYSDYIFAIIIEEYGILGGIVILFIYMVFLYRCVRLFKKSPYAFGAFLALALSVSLVIQALANMAVNVGLMPVTGVTLPLVSMGGSSFLFTCFSIGIILSVARNVEQLEGGNAIMN